MTLNQTPEQLARDNIDAQLKEAGWEIQNLDTMNFSSGLGIAIREYPTSTGPVDYALFVDNEPVGVIEAKPEEWGDKITTVEEQSSRYANSTLKYINNDYPLRFVFESTGVITRFTDFKDPKPKSRRIFSFFQPEIILKLSQESKSFRGRLHDLPELDHTGLRDCQITAVTNLEASFKLDKPRALVQMATGSGKTFTAITSSYRLLKHAKPKRILFLVDTKNLGEQAEQEFMTYIPQDDHRKFTELYTVSRLRSSYVPTDAEVYISTIQRMYSILKDEPLDESEEEESLAEQMTQPKEPLPVVYNKKIPPEFFDVIIIDECHRSIYNLWRQVLDYFDAYLVGLTATPDNRTYGFFNANVVSEYDHEKAVADGVNVGNDTFIIRTKTTQEGVKVEAERLIQLRERKTRKTKWQTTDEDTEYSKKQLDKDIVLPDQIRKVVQTYKNNLPNIFPGRAEVPKTLIFAKTDSHADDIIQIVRDEFGEGNDFCKKITYKIDEDPKTVLAQFRNNFYPRIAVTVDMIATGTDIRPLECLLFMRDVKSKNYFEQMKGRGTRTLDEENLKKVTPSAKGAKSRYVIVDAIGVTESLKTASQPLDSKPTVPLKDLARGLTLGAHDPDTVVSFANRLSRMERQLDDYQLELFEKESKGLSLRSFVKNLFDAVDSDKVNQIAMEQHGLTSDEEVTEEHVKPILKARVKEAVKIINGNMIDLLDTIRKQTEQVYLEDEIDEVVTAEWAGDIQTNSEALRKDFIAYLHENIDEISALNIYFNIPQQRAQVTYAMIKELLVKLQHERPKLAPLRVWDAFAYLESYDTTASRPINDLTALMSLLRRVCGLDEALVPYDATVRQNFKRWIFKSNNTEGSKFSDVQLDWLRMMRDHIANSFHIEHDDLEMAPFDSEGGLGRMYQLFGDEMDTIIEEMNLELVA